MQDLHFSSPSCVRNEALGEPLYKTVGAATATTRMTTMTTTPRQEACSSFSSSSPPPLLRPHRSNDAHNTMDDWSSLEIFDLVELPILMDEAMSSSTLLLPSLSSHLGEGSCETKSAPIRPCFRSRNRPCWI